MDVNDPIMLTHITRGRTDGEHMSASDFDVSSILTIKDLRFGSLEWSKGVFSAVVELQDCRIGSLRLRDVEAAHGIVLRDCDLGLVDLANVVHQNAIVFIRTRIGEMRLHRAGAITLDDVRSTGSLVASSLNGSIRISNATLDSLVIDGQGDVDEYFVVASEIEIERDITISNVTLAQIDVRKVRARSLQFQRLHLGRPITLADGHIVGNVDMHRLESGQETLVEATAVRVEGDFFVNDSACRNRLSVPPVNLRRVTVKGKLAIQLRAPSQPTLLNECSILGALSLVSGSSQYSLLANTSLTNVDLPRDVTFRTLNDVRKFCLSRFGASSVPELSVLRVALRDRPNEEDLAFYELRRRESVADSVWRRVLNIYVKGGVFGWGVRLWPPVRSLLIGLLLTAIFLHFTGLYGRSVLEGGDITDVGRSVAMAAALWLSVDIGSPATLSGAGWTAASVALTALGLVLITVTIGIGIRKLVR